MGGELGGREGETGIPVDRAGELVKLTVHIRTFYLSISLVLFFFSSEQRVEARMIAGVRFGSRGNEDGH